MMWHNQFLRVQQLYLWRQAAGGFADCLINGGIVMSWNYQPVRGKNGEITMREVYRNEDGSVRAWSGAFVPHDGSKEELITELEMMLADARRHPVLDERDMVASIPGSINNEEPGPLDGEDSVTGQVLMDLLERQELGKGRYGTELKTHNGRDPLVDAYQELLDLALYLRQHLMELESDKSNGDSKKMYCS